MNSALPDSGPLDQICALGGEDMLSGVVATFCEQRPANCATMAGALARLDFEELRRTAHRLKGSCASVGARPAAELCRALESSARANDAYETSRLIDRIEQELTRVERALRMRLGQGTGS